MSGTLSIDGTMGLIVLALPIAILALVVMWSVNSQAMKAVATDMPLPGPAPSASAVPAAKQALARQAPEAQVHKDQDDILAVSAASPSDGAAPVRANTKQRDAAPLQAVPAALLKEPQADSAEAEKVESLIEKSKTEVSAGNSDEAASLLGEAITLATQANLHDEHARARIELADIFLAKNDPITACEQWQIARNLYHDLEQTDARDSVDKKMLSSGCPTDWVLTDF